MPAPGCAHDVKQNVIHQTRPPPFIPPWYSCSYDAHMIILGAFEPLGEHSDTLQLYSPVQHAAIHMQCGVFTPLHHNQHKFFSNLWIAKGCGLDRFRQASLSSAHASVSLGCSWPRLFPGSQVVLSCNTTDTVGNNHSIPEAFHNTCSFLQDHLAGRIWSFLVNKTYPLSCLQQMYLRADSSLAVQLLTGAIVMK